jgi:hypothetical protein
MKNNTLGNILLVIGVISVIFSLISDIIGIGKIIGFTPDPRFGAIQIVGVGIGVILCIIGWNLKDR